MRVHHPIPEASTHHACTLEVPCIGVILHGFDATPFALEMSFDLSFYSVECALTYILGEKVPPVTVLVKQNSHDSSRNVTPLPLR